MAAALLVDAGLDPYRIDASLRKSPEMPMGVFSMSDLSGNDIVIHVSKMINEAYGDRTYNGKLGPAMVKAGRLGQKTGVGYYAYEKGKPKADVAGLAPILAESRAAGKVQQLAAGFTDQQIVEAVLFPVVNEAFRIIGEGHVIRESDMDMVSIMGYGFPAHQGGLIHWARRVGLKNVVARLSYYAELFGKSDPALARVFAPCETLKAEAAKAK